MRRKPHNVDTIVLVGIFSFSGARLPEVSKIIPLSISPRRYYVSLTYLRKATL